VLAPGTLPSIDGEPSVGLGSASRSMTYRRFTAGADVGEQDAVARSRTSDRPRADRPGRCRFTGRTSTGEFDDHLSGADPDLMCSSRWHRKWSATGTAHVAVFVIASDRKCRVAEARCRAGAVGGSPPRTARNRRVRVGAGTPARDPSGRAPAGALHHLVRHPHLTRGLSVGCGAWFELSHGSPGSPSYFTRGRRNVTDGNGGAGKLGSDWSPP
jgi:hypothetical protein